MTAAAAVLTEESFSRERLYALWALDHSRVMWRHDIDHSYELAVEMAALEHEHNIRAVYYLQADGCATREFALMAQKLLDYGHDLGTHVDLNLGRGDKISDYTLAAACVRQVGTLRSGWPEVGNRVSLHRPPQDAVWRDIPGFQHALSAFWRGCYSSDSRQRFRTPPERLLRRGGNAQINLHPEWWFLSPADAAQLRTEHEQR